MAPWTWNRAAIVGVVSQMTEEAEGEKFCWRCCHTFRSRAAVVVDNSKRTDVINHLNLAQPSSSSTHNDKNKYTRTMTWKTWMKQKKRLGCDVICIWRRYITFFHSPPVYNETTECKLFKRENTFLTSCCGFYFPLTSPSTLETIPPPLRLPST